MSAIAFVPTHVKDLKPGDWLNLGGDLFADPGNDHSILDEFLVQVVSNNTKRNGYCRITWKPECPAFYDAEYLANYSEAFECRSDHYVKLIKGDAS